MMTDPIADMLTRLRNANIAFHDEVLMPSSKQKEALARILVSEGYIVGFDVENDSSRPGRQLKITLKYSPDRERTISGLSACRSPACACTRRPTACRASSGAWASPSSRRTRVS